MTQMNRTWGGIALSVVHPAIGAWARNRAIAIAVLLLAMVQGLVYLAIVPPWQHYDEPTHFEYAWLIANRGRLPLKGEMDQPMRREVAASMLAHNFYTNVPKPDLLTDTGIIEIGISELGHPPAYYLLVSLPLRLVRYLDVTTQLYVARTVSVGLFVLTIGIALGLMRDLLPRGHVLGWAVPVALVLLPPFADVMTSVNNDVGAIVVFSFFLWLAVRTIRYGVSWGRVLLLCGSAALAVATKNTVSVAVVLAPLALFLAMWSQRGWRWRWLTWATISPFVVLLFATVGWGDAANWYRATPETVQVTSTRAEISVAPEARHALQLDAPTAPPRSVLLNPMRSEDVAQLAGQEITAGAWVWATEPISSATLSLDYAAYKTLAQQLSALPLTITTKPTFVAWSTTVPTNARQLHYRLAVEPTPNNRAVKVYLDGALIVPGNFPATEPPIFDDNDARYGTWAGSAFTNRLRNGSAEEAWPRLRPWVDRLLVTYARRSPTVVFSSLIDIGRTGQTLLYDVPTQVLFSFFGVFAWGHVRLERTAWLPVFQLVMAAAVIGCCSWTWQARRRTGAAVVPALAFLGIAGLLVWSNVVLRVLPLLDGQTIFAAPRYGFPAVLPAVLALVGGWRALFPARFRFHGTLVMLAAVVALDAVAVWTIWSFYHSLPT